MQYRGAVTAEGVYESADQVTAHLIMIRSHTSDEGTRMRAGEGDCVHSVVKGGDCEVRWL